MRIDRYFLSTSHFEPEGIYLILPLEGEAHVLQAWGAHPSYHARFTYNGIRLKGHPGLDLTTKPGSNVRAVDGGRITEISNEPGGFGRYLKIEHRWGESLYAHLGEILVETGQSVERGLVVARTDLLRRRYAPHVHFGLRIIPFNRFDGWGGFSDPLPFLYQLTLVAFEAGELPQEEMTPPPMVLEVKGRRRP